MRIKSLDARMKSELLGFGVPEEIVLQGEKVGGRGGFVDYPKPQTTLHMQEPKTPNPQP